MLILSVSVVVMSRLSCWVEFICKWMLNLVVDVCLQVYDVVSYRCIFNGVILCCIIFCNFHHLQMFRRVLKYCFENASYVVQINLILIFSETLLASSLSSPLIPVSLQRQLSCGVDPLFDETHAAMDKCFIFVRTFPF